MIYILFFSVIKWSSLGACVAAPPTLKNPEIHDKQDKDKFTIPDVSTILQSAQGVVALQQLGASGAASLYLFWRRLKGGSSSHLTCLSETWVYKTEHNAIRWITKALMSDEVTPSLRWCVHCPDVPTSVYPCKPQSLTWFSWTKTCQAAPDLLQLHRGGKNSPLSFSLP